MSQPSSLPQLCSRVLLRSALTSRASRACADFASQLQERLQGLDGGADVNSLVHELLASKAATPAGGEEADTPSSSGRPPVPKGPNNRPGSREVPKARNPLAPLPSDTHNRRPSSRQRDAETPTPGSYRTPTPGSYRKVPAAPSSEGGADQKRPLSREQRRRVEARRKRESSGDIIPFGASPTWSVSSERSRESSAILSCRRFAVVPLLSNQMTDSSTLYQARRRGRCLLCQSLGRTWRTWRTIRKH